MSYLRTTLTAWNPGAASDRVGTLTSIAARLAEQNRRISSKVVCLRDTGAWSGGAHDAASEQMARIASSAEQTADRIERVRDVVTAGLEEIDTARLRLLHLADLAEVDGFLVSDAWSMVPVNPAAEGIALKLAEWTATIDSGLAHLIAADRAAAASVEAAATALRNSNRGMHGFLPIAVVGLGMAVELATAAFIAAGVVSGAAVIALLLEKFGGIASVDEIMDKIPDVFRSDDGPGQWEARNHHMSERAMEYQEQVTGSPPGTEYVVDGVAFDGYEDETLLDAKGLGYEKHLDENGNWKPYFTGANELVKQAGRQVAAAGENPIEWRVADERAAEAIQKTLDLAGFGKIEVVHVPPR